MDLMEGKQAQGNEEGIVVSNCRSLRSGHLASIVLLGAVFLSTGCSSLNQSLVFNAAARGNLEAVKKNVAEGKNVEACLNGAVSQSRTNVVRYLLANGANPNARFSPGMGVPGPPAPLVLAITRGDTAIADMLIEAGADISLRHGRNGDTTLIKAAALGSTSTCQLLLAHGADVRETNNQGQTALQYAAGTGLRDVSLALIKAGASVESEDRNGVTPFLAAMECSSNDRAFLDTLREHVKDIRHTDKQGHTALFFAGRGINLCAMVMLAELGLSPDDKNLAGATMREAAVTSIRIQRRVPSLPSPYRPSARPGVPAAAGWKGVAVYAATDMLAAGVAKGLAKLDIVEEDLVSCSSLDVALADCAFDWVFGETGSLDSMMTGYLQRSFTNVYKPADELSASVRKRLHEQAGAGTSAKLIGFVNCSDILSPKVGVAVWSDGIRWPQYVDRKSEPTPGFLSWEDAARGDVTIPTAMAYIDSFTVKMQDGTEQKIVPYATHSRIRTVAMMLKHAGRIRALHAMLQQK